VDKGRTLIPKTRNDNVTSVTCSCHFRHGMQNNAMWGQSKPFREALNYKRLKLIMALISLLWEHKLLLSDERNSLTILNQLRLNNDISEKGSLNSGRFRRMAPYLDIHTHIRNFSQYALTRWPNIGSSHVILECSWILNHFFFAVALRPNAGHGLLILEVSRSHTTKHHSR